MSIPFRCKIICIKEMTIKEKHTPGAYKVSHSDYTVHSCSLRSSTVMPLHNLHGKHSIIASLSYSCILTEHECRPWQLKEQLRPGCTRTEGHKNSFRLCIWENHSTHQLLIQEGKVQCWRHFARNFCTSGVWGNQRHIVKWEFHLVYLKSSDYFRVYARSDCLFYTISVRFRCLSDIHNMECILSTCTTTIKIIIIIHCIGI